MCMKRDLEVWTRVPGAWEINLDIYKRNQCSREIRICITLESYFVLYPNTWFHNLDFRGNCSLFALWLCLFNNTCSLHKYFSNFRFISHTTLDYRSILSINWRIRYYNEPNNSLSQAINLIREATCVFMVGNGILS